MADRDGKAELSVHLILGASEETKIIGLSWNTSSDKVGVVFRESSGRVTKRSVLSTLAAIYDPLGIVSPVTLMGKVIFRDTCDMGLKWDEELPAPLAKRWHSWSSRLPEKIEVPRSIAAYKEKIQAVDLHGFGDTSGTGTAAAVYAVIEQKSGVSQSLVAAKARLAKKALTIPRLELVSGHMVAVLIDNLRVALDGLPIRHCYGWLDSTVALYWISGQGNYKQFVNNRVNAIREKGFIEWRHVGTADNPADIGSRGSYGSKMTTEWLDGPKWLTDPSSWPEDKMIDASKDSEVEAKPLLKELYRGAQKEPEDRLHKVLEKHGFWKTVRITAWVGRFTHNARSKRQERTKGALKTNEVQKQVDWWIGRGQESKAETEQLKDDTQRLNLVKNEKGLLECRGRIQGDYPIYIPPDTLLAEKIAMDAHFSSLHGGVGLTMTAVRERFWIPRLRSLTKRVVKACYGCKRFHAVPFPRPPTGNLPADRTQGERPFQVVGIDYAGPIMYKRTPSSEGKAYILLYGCSLTRAIHLDVLPDLTEKEFRESFKRFTARRGRPEKIYSDNAKTFCAASKWIKKIERSEELNDYLAKLNIVWQFNLSRAPWWGGQYERLIGLMKQAMYKVVGQAKLTWKELQDVILDVEVCLNNRPLSYVEDDVQLPVLTPNVMISGQHYPIIEADEESSEEVELRKRAKHVKRCKESVWKRWTGEYLRGLRERHNLTHKGKQMTPKVGDVLMIKGDEKNRGKWSIGVVEQLFEGRDGVVRGVSLRKQGDRRIERAVQHLYPLELACTADVQPGRHLNADAEVFRPRRRAAQVARDNIAEINRFEEDAFI